MARRHLIAYAGWVRTAEALRRTLFAGAIGCCCVGAAAAMATVAHATTLPPAPAPAELVTLEQKMAQIQFNTLRFRLAEEVSLNAGAFAGLLSGGSSGSLSTGGSALGLSQARAAASDVPPIQEGAKISFTTAGEGVASISPAAGEFEVKEGTPIAWERLVGGKLYEYQPRNPSSHPHRPWVSRKEQASTELLGASSHLATGALPGSQSGFSGLIALLAKAQRFESSGPATLAGEPVSGFTAVLSPADLISGGNIEKELKGLTKSGLSSASLELLITPAGLPARVRLLLGGALASAAVAIEIVGLEVPVNVQAPPPRQTVTATRVRQIERRHACIKLHVSKHKTERICSKPQTPSESESLFGA